MNVVLWLLQIVLGIQRGELKNIFLNVLLALLAGFVAYGRWRLATLPERSASN